jgi:hypothetical protein
MARARGQAVEDMPSVIESAQRFIVDARHA